MAERTIEEIVARIEAIENRDFLGFEREILMVHIPPSEARAVGLVTDKTIDWPVKARDEAGVKAEMLNYLPFAWEKANGFRGISAYRSLAHFDAWMWLLGQETTYADGYKYYGKDELVAISKFLGVDPDQWDDGVRLNSEPD